MKLKLLVSLVAVLSLFLATAGAEETPKIDCVRGLLVFPQQPQHRGREQFQPERRKRFRCLQCK